MINSLLLQIPINLPIILTNMLRIPPITPTPILAPLICRKRRRCPLQRYIPRTHNRLPDILKAVIDMPRHFDDLGVPRRQNEIVRVEDGVEAVELVGHGCCVDGLVGVIVNGLGEVVVFGGVFDVDVA